MQWHCNLISRSWKIFFIYKTSLNAFYQLSSPGDPISRMNFWQGLCSSRNAFFLWSFCTMSTVSQECLDKMNGCFSSMKRLLNSNLLPNHKKLFSSISAAKLKKDVFFSTKFLFLDFQTHFCKKVFVSPLLDNFQLPLILLKWVYRDRY